MVREGRQARVAEWVHGIGSRVSGRLRSTPVTRVAVITPPWPCVGGQ